MKKIHLSILSFFLTSAFMFGQTFCLQLTQVSNDGSNLIVKIEMQGSAEFKLGSSNLQFSYNTTGLSNPVLESSPLAPPFYQIPTVTKPASDQTSFNIELGFAGFGVIISETPGWTELGQIKFTIEDASQTAGMNWSYNGGTTLTVVFLDDEATQIFATDPNCLVGLDISLPTELTSFRANLLPNATTLLNWHTESETNNEGFEIERSFDGRKFENIGFVEGQGSTTTAHDYKFIDPHPQPGINYYRLRQIDYDGKFEYSKIRSVELKNDDGFKVPEIYPNPVGNGQLTLYIPNHFNETSTLSIYAHSGQLLRKSTVNNSINSLNINNLPAGIYLFEVMSGNKFWRERVIVH